VGGTFYPFWKIATVSFALAKNFHVGCGLKILPSHNGENVFLKGLAYANSILLYPSLKLMQAFLKIFYL
jgi:hypothetical protein